MTTIDDKTQKLSFPGINPRDIHFECPACGKSLVVDEAAQGLIVDCPQCHNNVIVPPKQPPSAPPERPQPAKTVPSELAVLHERLMALGHQLKELQAQRTEINNRLASRLNEINRDLVLVARLETSHQQVMSEWNQIVSQMGTSSAPTAAGGASARSGRSRVQFGV